MREKIKCKGRKARESSIQIFLCFRFTKQEFSVTRNLSLRFNFLLKKYLKILSFNSSSFFFSFFFLERMGFLKKLLADKTRTPLLFVTFLLELAFYQKCFVSLGWVSLLQGYVKNLTFKSNLPFVWFLHDLIAIVAWLYFSESLLRNPKSISFLSKSH